MTGITDFFTMLGSHFIWIVIGCAEAGFGAFLAAAAVRRRKPVRKKSKLHGEEKKLFEEMNRCSNAVYVLVRAKDRMPVQTAGDMEKLLLVSEKRLKEDIMVLETRLQNPEEGKKIWKQYDSWDQKEPFTAEFQLKNKTWIRMTVRCCADSRYDLMEFLDITEQYEQMRGYESRLKESDNISRSKTAFLSRMSHEIRTPMNGILGMITLAKEKLTPGDPVLSYLEKADQLSGHMLALINDILDMSRIEAGKVELEEKPFHLRELGERLYDMFAKGLMERKIRYEIGYENMTEDYVIGDELRISQIIINFLSNAVKFTSEGEITVTFRQMLVQDGVMDLLVRVHDTGIGMKPEFLERIFHPFEQESIEISHKYGGTGLGMAITDQLVKLMGGEIVVQSMPGEGSDFFVYLHLAVADSSTENKNTRLDEAAEETESYSFDGSRILLAEDNEFNAMIAIEMLEQRGAFVCHVEDGKQAVEAFLNHPEDYFDFILMDVQMPVMDGREAARTIRALAREDANRILIFALSADAFVEDERLSRESGMNAHFAKPIDFDAMQRAIGTFMKEKKNG